jgi:hypothetical protein
MYRVILEGVAIECDSMEEAKRLARSIANENQAGEAGRGRTVTARRGQSFDIRSAKLLRCVREAGTGGILGAKLAAALGLETPKGLGPITAALNKRLRAARIDPKLVYEGGRIGKERGWFAREKIDEALKLIEVQ